MGVRFKVISLVTLLVILTASVLTVINLLEIRTISSTSAVSSLRQKAEKEALALGHWLDNRLATLRTISVDFQNFLMLFEKSFVTMTLKAKLDQLEPLGFVDWFMTNSEGKAYTFKDKELDLSQAEFFKAIVQEGKSYFLASGINWEGERSIVFAVPIYSYEGIAEGILGAIMPQKLLQDLVSSIKYGQTGYAYITDFSGKVVAHAKQEYVSKKLSEIDSTLRPVEEQVAKKVVAHISYTFDNVKRLVAMAPVQTAGWMLSVGILESELNAPFVESLKKSLLTTAAAVLISVVIGFLFGRAVTKPILNLADFSKQVASGDLTGRFETTSKDEIGQLSKAFVLLVENLKNSVTKIVDLKANATDFSNKLVENIKKTTNLSEEVDELTEKTSKLVGEISESISEVNSGIEEISSGAENVAKNAARLAEGAESLKQKGQQASSSIQKLADKISLLSTASAEAMATMDKLVQMSQQIEIVTNTISSIAEQTNLLALNAAIEAARAGEAGRGFAVVADEIRKLAEESRKSTQTISNTLKEIRDLTNSVAKGGGHISEELKSIVKVMEETVQDIGEIVQEIDKFSSFTNDLAATSEEQSGAVQEIAAATDKIVRNVEVLKDALSRVSSAVEQQASETKSLSTAADELNRIVSDLQQLASRYKI